MADKRVMLTEEGLKKLEDKLEYLKSVRRIEVAERIKQAIDFGDISENSEYEDAKNEQAFIEGEVLNLEKMLRNSDIIREDQTSNKGTVRMGNTVVIRDLEFNEDMEYTLVGSAEADPAENRISNESPVGEAIIGQEVGTTVEVRVPAGVLKYQVVEIKD
jgi:transcription elongation factor GreA